MLPGPARLRLRHVEFGSRRIAGAFDLSVEDCSPLGLQRVGLLKRQVKILQVEPCRASEERLRDQQELVP